MGPGRGNLVFVSDLDNTLKEGNTLAPSEPVQRMPQVFSRLRKRYRKASFVYLTNRYGPFGWLGESPETFLKGHFPRGVIVIRKWYDLGGYLLGTATHKRASLAALLARFETAVLIGDSDERDPETYLWAARAFPHKRVLICIRDLTGAGPSDPRWATVFAGLVPGRWLVYAEVEALERFILGLLPLA